METTGRRATAVSVFGWYGTLAILAAYAANTAGWLESSSSGYQLLNLSGASGVAAVCFVRRTWQAFFLEVAWALIAAASLVRTFAGT